MDLLRSSPKILLHMRTLNHPMDIESHSQIVSLGNTLGLTFLCVFVYRHQLVELNGDWNQCHAECVVRSEV
jgi:hypothetical protein